jgi:hypothetical protein
MRHGVVGDYRNAWGRDRNPPGLEARGVHRHLEAQVLELPALHEREDRFVLDEQDAWAAG